MAGILDLPHKHCGRGGCGGVLTTRAEHRVDECTLRSRTGCLRKPGEGYLGQESAGPILLPDPRCARQRNREEPFAIWAERRAGKVALRALELERAAGAVELPYPCRPV